MGLRGVVDTAGRGAYFRRVLTGLGTFERGSPEWRAEAFLNAVGGDPVALLRVLDTFVDTPREAFTRITVPVLVLTGEADDDNGSAAALAAALPDGTHATVPGTHMSAVTEPRLGALIAGFLDAATGS